MMPPIAKMRPAQTGPKSALRRYQQQTLARYTAAVRPHPPDSPQHTRVLLQQEPPAGRATLLFFIR